MSIFDGIGTIREFYLDQLEYSNTINEPDFLVNAAAQVLKKYGGKNWVPIIIKDIGEDKYEIIGSSFVYAIAKAAKLEKILCIVIESTDEAEEISKILSKEVLPKINLSIANKDEIKATFEYLKSQSNTPLSKIPASSIESLANKIVNSNRQYWTDVTPLGNLGTSLIKDNLEFISNVFYLTPIQPPEPPKINLSIVNKDEIKATFKYLKSQFNSPLSKISASSIESLANKIVNSNRQYWTDLTPLGNLGTSTNLIKGNLEFISNVFYLTPIQPPAPPKINLSIANRDQIMEGLEFLKKERKLNIDILDASTKLEQAEKKYWIDYKGVLDLKIKIKDDKLDDFKSVFSLRPQLLELPLNIDALPIKKLREIVKKMGLFIKTRPAKKDYIEVIQKNINSLLNISEES